MQKQNGKDYTIHVVSSKRKKKATHFELKLTSMIDMFTILLVFLLKNYSAEGQIMSVSPDLRLPESTAQKAPQTTSIIAVTQNNLLLDGHKVTTVDQIMNSSSNLIPPLLNELQIKRNISERVGELSSNISFTGKISIQADKELPYLIIKKIMFTCGRVGYNEIMFAVSKPD